MTDKEKALERFVQSEKDEAVKVSQCTNCKNLVDGVKCKFYDKPPWEYRNALSKLICPNKRE